MVNYIQLGVIVRNFSNKNKHSPPIEDDRMDVYRSRADTLRKTVQVTKQNNFDSLRAQWKTIVLILASLPLPCIGDTSLDVT